MALVDTLTYQDIGLADRKIEFPLIISSVFELNGAGMINKIFLDKVNNEIIKIYSPVSFILREYEEDVQTFFAQKGFAPIILRKLPNGRVERFIPSIPSFDLKIFAKRMKQFHDHSLSRYNKTSDVHEPDIYDRINILIEWARQEGLTLNGKFDEIERIFNETKLELNSFSHKIFQIHGDLHRDNILVPESGNDYIFIDFEFTCKGTIEQEIAHFFCEYMGCNVDVDKIPSDDVIIQFIRVYYGIDDVDPSQLHIIHLWMTILHIFWTLWAFKMHLSLTNTECDYLTYGTKRAELIFRKNCFR